jgi:hypothetical protein
MGKNSPRKHQERKVIRSQARWIEEEGGGQGKFHFIRNSLHSIMLIKIVGSYSNSRRCGASATASCPE